MTSIPPIKVDIVAGENTAIPELQRTGTEIARVAAGASGGLSPIQKLSRAMILSEGREGSLVIRELRGTIGSLAGEALGASGHLGRLGANLGMFAVGGATGLAVVAGIAAIGYAWKKADEAAQLAADNAVAITDRLKRVFGSVMKNVVDDPAEGLRKLRAAATEARDQLAAAQSSPLGPQLFRSEVSPQGFTVSVPLNDPQQQHVDAITAADNKARAAQQALNEALIASADAGEKATGALQRQSEALEATNAVRAFALEKGHDERTMLLDVAEATARAQAKVLGLDDAHTIALVTQARRLEALKLETQALEEQKNVLQEITQISADISRFFASGFAQATIQDIHIPTFDEIMGRTKHGTNVNEDVAGAEIGRAKRAAFEFDAPFGKQAGLAMGKAFVEAGLNKRGGLDIQRIGSESLAEIAALRSGNAGAAVTSGGALLSTLGADKAHGGLELAGFGPAGIALSLVGTAISLFDNGADRRHREQMAVLKRIAEKPVPEGRTLQPIYVGANAANAGQVGYEVGRFQDRDGVYRGVGGMS